MRVTLPNPVQGMITLTPALTSRLTENLARAPLEPIDFSNMTRLADRNAAEIERLATYTSGLARHWGVALREFAPNSHVAPAPVTELAKRADTKKPGEKITNDDQLKKSLALQSLAIGTQAQLFAPNFTDMDTGVVLINDLPESTFTQSGLRYLTDIDSWQDARSAHQILWSGALWQSRDTGVSGSTPTRHVQLRIPHLLWLTAALFMKDAESEWGLHFYNHDEEKFTSAQIFTSIHDRHVIPVGISFKTPNAVDDHPFVHYFRDMARAARVVAMTPDERTEWQKVYLCLQALPDPVKNLPPVKKYLETLACHDSLMLRSSVACVNQDFHRAISAADEPTKSLYHQFYRFITSHGNELGIVTTQFIEFVFNDNLRQKWGFT